MSEGSTSSPDPAEEADYYRHVEEAFVERRGDPMFLSNADWLLIRRWRKRGVPLRVVLRGIRDAFDARELSWARERKVRSLRYCEAAVDAAAEHWQRALELGRDGPDVEGRLGDLVRALREAEGLGAGAAREAASFARALEKKLPGATPSEALDRWLARREGRLIAALRAELAPEIVAELERSVDAALDPYGARMPSEVLSQIREESVTRRLLERAGLPRFSLFH